MMSCIYVPDRAQLICHEVSQSYSESKYVELFGKKMETLRGYKKYEYGIVSLLSVQFYSKSNNCEMSPSCPFHDDFSSLASNNQDALLAINLKNSLPDYRLLACLSRNLMLSAYQWTISAWLSQVSSQCTGVCGRIHFIS